MDLDAAAGDEPWPFMCECGSSDCIVQVPLTLAQYDQLRATDRPLLAEGHSITRAARARRKARELGEGAEALRAQATLQHSRARKNLEQRDS